MAENKKFSANSLWEDSIPKKSTEQTVTISAANTYVDRNIKLTIPAWAVVHTGAGAPASSLGKDGDIYIQII